MNNESKDNKNGLGDIFKGLGKLFNVIVDMAEKNTTEKKRTGELFDEDNGIGLTGKYDFSMKLGVEEKDVANMLKNPQVIEPHTDIFKEDGHTVVIVEMPGVTEENFSYDLQGRSLNIIGIDNVRTYKKVIEMYELDNNPSEITVSENNGIFKIIMNN